MGMKNDFCVFIPTHGRAKKVATINTLRRCGYTGRIYLVVDDEDSELPAYKSKFGNDVLVFNKDEVAPRIDRMNNFNIRGTVLFAREAIQSIARDIVKVSHYVVLDDDYQYFQYIFNDRGDFVHKRIKNLDKIFDIMVDFLISTGATVIAMAQAGDYIGGENSYYGKKIFLDRKIMNSFVCSSAKPYKYFGALNDDVNCYIFNGNVGMLLFTTNLISLNQAETQSLEGGLTDMYKAYGTYVKSFSSVMMRPSSVKIKLMGTSHPRIHHLIKKNLTYPRIVPQSVKKK